MRWALVCALLLCGCHKPVPPRILHVQVAAGPDFRRQTNWRDLIASRIRAASEIFRPLNLQLEMAGVSEWEPDPQLPPEVLRWTLAGFHPSGDWINLGFYGSAQQESEPGLSVPFDSRVLVYNISGAPETRQTAALAHQVAHVLGAWHTRDGGWLMSLPPGEKIDASARACLEATRQVDLRQGAAGLDANALARLQKLFADSKASSAMNPLYRYYSATGTEALRRGLRADVEANFKQAAKFAPDVSKAHIDLGNSRLATRDYSDAVDEFRAAVKLDPHSPAAMSGLAAALMGSGHRDEAVQALANTVRMNPADPTAHANMGVVLASMPGHLDEGIAELREALRIDPNSKIAKRSLDAALEAKAKAAR
jgi:tetratricopeptide (TPR) repeat protein